MTEQSLKIVVDTKDLLHVLSFANSVVAKRNVLQELSNIKLTAYGNILEISSTDIDLYLKQKIGAQIHSGGETTVPGKIFFDIINKIPDQEVTIIKASSAQQLEITGQNCQFNLLTLDSESFPTVEEVKAASKIKLPCVDFIKLLDYTKFAMSLEESRYNFNGIYLHIKDSKFCAAATDGHRLSVAMVPINGEIQEFGVILPAKTVTEIAKIAADAKNIMLDIDILLSANKIQFICGDTILISKLIDGTFPEYESFIPTNNINTLTVNNKLLADAINRAYVVTTDKFRAVKLSLTAENLKITASGEAVGNFQEYLEYSQEPEKFCRCNSTKEITIGFNPKYISDVLKAIDHAKTAIHFSTESAPILIKIVEPLGKTESAKEQDTDKKPKVPQAANDKVECFFVIMPVKV